MKKLILTLAISAISYINIQAQSYADIKGFGLALLDTNGNVIKQVITGTYPQSTIHKFERINDSIFRTYLFVYKDSAINNDYVVFQGRKFDVRSAIGNDYVLLMNHNFDILYSSDTSIQQASNGSDTDNLTNIIYSIMSFNGTTPPIWGIGSYKTNDYDIIFTKTGYKKLFLLKPFGGLGNDYPVSIQLVAPNRLLVSWMLHELSRGLSTDENITIRNTSFIVSPNPATNELRLNFGDEIPQITNIKIFDASGRQLYLGTNAKNIDVTDYKVGIYLIQINYKDGSIAIQKFVKANQ